MNTVRGDLINKSITINSTKVDDRNNKIIVEEAGQALT